MEYIGLLFGIIIGFALGYLVKRVKTSSMDQVTIDIKVNSEQAVKEIKNLTSLVYELEKRIKKLV